MNLAAAIALLLTQQWTPQDDARWQARRAAEHAEDLRQAATDLQAQKDYEASRAAEHEAIFRQVAESQAREKAAKEKFAADAARERQIHEEQQQKEQAAKEACEADPSCLAARWSQVICDARAEKKEALDDIRAERAASKIGGVIDVHEIYVCQEQFRIANEKEIDARRALKALHRKPIACSKL